MNAPTAGDIAVLLLTLEHCVPKHMSFAEALQRAFEAGKIVGHLEGLDKGFAIGSSHADALAGIAQDIESIINQGNQ